MTLYDRFNKIHAYLTKTVVSQLNIEEFWEASDDGMESVLRNFFVMITVPHKEKLVDDLSRIGPYDYARGESTIDSDVYNYVNASEHLEFVTYCNNACEFFIDGYTAKVNEDPLEFEAIYFGYLQLNKCVSEATVCCLTPTSVTLTGDCKNISYTFSSEEVKLDLYRIDSPVPEERDRNFKDLKIVKIDIPGTGTLTKSARKGHY